MYSFLYFLKGELPWMGVGTLDQREKYIKIMELKLTTPIEILCGEIAEELCTIMYYTKSLKFDEKPDYEYYRKALHDILDRQDEHKLDWEAIFSSEKEMHISN